MIIYCNRNRNRNIHKQNNDKELTHPNNNFPIPDISLNPKLTIIKHNKYLTLLNPP